MSPILKNGPIKRLQLMQVQGLIVPLSIPQGMVMGPLYNRDGIDLDVSQLVYNSQGLLFPGFLRDGIQSSPNRSPLQIVTGYYRCRCHDPIR